MPRRWRNGNRRSRCSLPSSTGAHLPESFWADFGRTCRSTGQARHLFGERFSPEADAILRTYLRHNGNLPLKRAAALRARRRGRSCRGHGVSCSIFISPWCTIRRSFLSMSPTLPGFRSRTARQFTSAFSSRRRTQSVCVMVWSANSPNRTSVPWQVRWVQYLGTYEASTRLRRPRLSRAALEEKLARRRLPRSSRSICRSPHNSHDSGRKTHRL